MDAVRLFNEYASAYLEKNGDLSLYKKTLKSFLAELPENANIIEVACGPGNITAFLLKEHPDLKITATDPAPKMIEIAKEHCPGATFLCKHAHEAFDEELYDGVVAGFLLPYLSPNELIELFKLTYNKLKPKGAFYISWIHKARNGSLVQRNSKGNKLEVHYYSVEYLKKQLKQIGFSVLAEEIHANPNNGDEEGQLVVLR